MKYTYRYFEVSAAWMKACGHGEQAQIFPVLLAETNMVGGRGFDAFLELDISGFPNMFGKVWTVAAARGQFVPFSTPDGAYIATYYTDGDPARPAGQNKGRRTALAYYENKRAIVSFPARLNNFKMVELDDVPGILAGVSVAAAMTEFNREVVRNLAANMNAEKLDWCAIPNNDADEFILCAFADGIFVTDGATNERFERISDSWINEAARLAERGRKAKRAYRRAFGMFRRFGPGANVAAIVGEYGPLEHAAQSAYVARTSKHDNYQQRADFAEYFGDLRALLACFPLDLSNLRRVRLGRKLP